MTVMLACYHQFLTELSKTSLLFFTEQASYRRLDSFLLGSFVQGVLAAIDTAKTNAFLLQ